MNSHITVPKCVLKQFALDKNGFYKYDVQTKIISRGYPKTTFTEEGVVLTKGEEVDCGEMLHLDLSRQPDLAQTLVVTCAMLKKPFHFTGLQTLKIKETDRITALRTELLKMGISVGEANDSELFCETYDNKVCANSVVEVATYDDHRMAMAFAPAALCHENLTIEHPEVVTKSYPGFWEDLKQIDRHK
jgi:3-phosphoshikimate 1-carboxyvinyltransferase